MIPEPMPLLWSTWTGTVSGQLTVIVTTAGLTLCAAM